MLMLFGFSWLGILCLLCLGILIIPFTIGTIRKVDLSTVALLCSISGLFRTYLKLRVSRTILMVSHGLRRSCLLLMGISIGTILLMTLVRLLIVMENSLMYLFLVYKEELPTTPFLQGVNFVTP